MSKTKIFMILVQIDEAHTDKWPIGLEHPFAQKDMSDRLERAQSFVAENMIDAKAFRVVVDNWSDDFAEIFRSWPDKYYCLNKDLVIEHMSEYGKYADAKVDLDCLDLIKKLTRDW